MFSLLKAIRRRLRRSPDAGPLKGPAIMFGVVTPFHPELHEIGEQVGCWRLDREPDHEYAHRLALHITEELNELDELLNRVLALKV